MDRNERRGGVLGALADPTRRAVLRVVARHGEATATLAARELPVSRQAVVKHLGILDEAGLVKSRRRGREVRYRVCAEPMRAAARWLDAAADAWGALDTTPEALRGTGEAP